MLRSKSVDWFCAGSISLFPVHICRTFCVVLSGTVFLHRCGVWFVLVEALRFATSHFIELIVDIYLALYSMYNIQLFERLFDPYIHSVEYSGYNEDWRLVY